MFQKKGIQALLCEKELREVQDDSPNIFQSNIVVICSDPVQHSALENTVKPAQTTTSLKRPII